MAIGTATALALGSVASAGIGAAASSSAGNKVAKAARDEVELQQMVYEDTSEKLEPFREGGTNAFAAYLSELGLADAPEGYGGYEQSPMAQYLMEEGAGSIDAAFAARGGYNSGAALEALEDNRRQIISADTTDYFNRLLGVAGMGMDATTMQGSAGQYYASSAGGAGMAGARGSAQAQMGAASAFQTGISDMAGIYGYFNSSNPMAAYANPMFA